MGRSEATSRTSLYYQISIAIAARGSDITSPFRESYGQMQTHIGHHGVILRTIEAIQSETS